MLFLVVCSAQPQEVVATRDINVQLGTHLIEVRGKEREAVFEVLGPDCQPVSQKVIKYDMLHVTPPQGPFGVVAQSELANVDGWVDVDAEVSFPALRVQLLMRQAGLRSYTRKRDISLEAFGPQLADRAIRHVSSNSTRQQNTPCAASLTKLLTLLLTVAADALVLP